MAHDDTNVRDDDADLMDDDITDEEREELRQSMADADDMGLGQS